LLFSCSYALAALRSFPTRRSSDLGVTLMTTLEGFVAAAVGGVVLALLFNQSKWLEYSLFPYAVVLQVTPVIAIAPLLLIYLQQQDRKSTRLNSSHVSISYAVFCLK